METACVLKNVEEEGMAYDCIRPNGRHFYASEELMEAKISHESFTTPEQLEWITASAIWRSEPTTRAHSWFWNGSWHQEPMMADLHRRMYQ